MVNIKQNKFLTHSLSYLIPMKFVTTDFLTVINEHKE
jgi:hypothetical protein